MFGWLPSLVDAGALRLVMKSDLPVYLSGVSFHNVPQPRSIMNDVPPTLSGIKGTQICSSVTTLWYGIHPYYR